MIGRVTPVNYANVMGMKEDTGITGNQFSLMATIFYISFIVCEFPTGYLMQRLPLSRYLGANIMLWGIVVAANAGTCCKSRHCLSLVVH